MNPRLHLTVHEIVAAQLADDDPPEVWATAQRLRRLGYGRHEILHMLGAAMAPQLWAALHDQREYDLDEHRAALAALPDSWERGRPGGPAPPAARALHAAEAKRGARPSARHAAATGVASTSSGHLRTGQVGAHAERWAHTASRTRRRTRSRSESSAPGVAGTPPIASPADSRDSSCEHAPNAFS